MVDDPGGFMKAEDDDIDDVLGRFRALLPLLPGGVATDAAAAAVGLIGGDQGRLGFNSVCSSSAGCSSFPAVILGFEVYSKAQTLGVERETTTIDR